MHEVGSTCYVRLKWKVSSNLNSTFEKVLLHQILWEFHQFCASYSWKTWRISSTTRHENKLFLLISLWVLSTSTSQPTHSWWYVWSRDCWAPNQGFMNVVSCWQKGEITGIWMPSALLDKTKGITPASAFWDYKWPLGCFFFFCAFLLHKTMQPGRGG